MTFYQAGSKESENDMKGIAVDHVYTNEQWLVPDIAHIQAYHWFASWWVSNILLIGHEPDRNWYTGALS